MNHLKGKKIMLTRTVEQNKTSSSLLSELGATAVMFPCIHIENLNTSIQSGLAKLRQNNPNTTDIIFSSSNGVLAVAANVSSLADTLAGFSIIAVGNKTASALKDLGLNVDIIPSDASQQGLIQTYKTTRLPKQVYFFRAEQGSDILGDYLTSQGVDITLIHTYRSTCLQHNPAEVVQQLKQGEIDAVLLGSAKTAEFYVQKIKTLNLSHKPAIAVMSTQVAQAADKSGLSVQVIAEKPGFRAMLDGLNQYFANKQ